MIRVICIVCILWINIVSASIPSPTFSFSFVRRDLPSDSSALSPPPDKSPIVDNSIRTLSLMDSSDYLMRQMRRFDQRQEMPKTIIYRGSSMPRLRKRRFWKVKKIRKVRKHAESWQPRFNNRKYRRAKTFIAAPQQNNRRDKNSFIKMRRIDGSVLHRKRNPRIITTNNRLKHSASIRRSPPSTSTLPPKAARPSLIAPIPLLDELNLNLIKMENALNQILTKMVHVISPIYPGITPPPDIALQNEHLVDAEVTRTHFNMPTTSAPSLPIYWHDHYEKDGKFADVKAQFSKVKQIRRVRKDKMNDVMWKQLPMFYRQRRLAAKRRRMKREIDDGTTNVRKQKRSSFEQMISRDAEVEAVTDDESVSQMLFDMLESFGITALNIQTSNGTFTLRNDRNIKITPIYERLKTDYDNTQISIQSSQLNGNLSLPL